MIGTKELLNTIVESIQDKKGKEIKSIDLTKLEYSVCDYFIICHAESTTQVAAIAGSLEDKTREALKIKPYHTEGLNNATWVLVDYGDIVVHVFQEPFRRFYNLESLWADGKIENHEYLI